MNDNGWKLLLGVAAAIVVLAGLRAASTVLIPVVVAAMVALVAYPLMAWLRGRGVPMALAVAITIVAALVALAGPMAIVGTAATRFVARVPQYRDALQKLSGEFYAWLEAHGIAAPPPLADAAAILDWMTFALTGLAALLSNVFLIVLIAAFILVEAAEFKPKLRAAFGMDDRDVARVTAATEGLYQFLWLKTVVSALTGLAAGLWTAMLGIEFAVLWGLVAFLLNYIPNFGSLMAAVPPVLLGLIQFGPGRAALVAVGYVILNIALGSILEPRLIGRRLGMSPLVLLIALVCWGWLWGPAGLLLAVPMTMGVRVVLEAFDEARWLAVLLTRAPRASGEKPGGAR